MCRDSGTTRTTRTEVVPVDVQIRHSTVPCSTLIVKSTRAKYGYGGAMCPSASDMHLQYVYEGTSQGTYLDRVPIGAVIKGKRQKHTILNIMSQ